MPGELPGQRSRTGRPTWFDQNRGRPSVHGQRPRSGREGSGLKVCVPITADGQVDPRWGTSQPRRGRRRGRLRDPRLAGVHRQLGNAARSGTEGAHHARVAQFLRDNQVQVIAVHHVGPGMQRMLSSMAIRLVTGPWRRRPRRGTRGRLSANAASAVPASRRHRGERPCPHLPRTSHPAGNSPSWPSPAVTGLLPYMLQEPPICSPALPAAAPVSTGPNGAFCA